MKGHNPLKRFRQACDLERRLNTFAVEHFRSDRSGRSLRYLTVLHARRERVTTIRAKLAKEAAKADYF